MDNYDIINGKLYKKCTNNNIRNPKTLRCVNIKNPLGIRIIKNQNTNHCTNTTIFNPISQRCISIKSKIGRNLLGISHKYTLPTYNSNQDKILHHPMTLSPFKTESIFIIIFLNFLTFIQIIKIIVSIFLNLINIIILSISLIII